MCGVEFITYLEQLLESLYPVGHIQHTNVGPRGGFVGRDVGDFRCRRSSQSLHTGVGVK